MAFQRVLSGWTWCSGSVVLAAVHLLCTSPRPGQSRGCLCPVGANWSWVPESLESRGGLTAPGKSRSKDYKNDTDSVPEGQVGTEGILKVVGRWLSTDAVTSCMYPWLDLNRASPLMCGGICSHEVGRLFLPQLPPTGLSLCHCPGHCNTGA